MNIGDAIWEIFKWKTPLEGYRREKQPLNRNMLIKFVKRQTRHQPNIKEMGEKESCAAPCSLLGPSHKMKHKILWDNWQSWDGSKLG